MLRSELCDYSDAYIIVKGKGTIIVEGDSDTKIRNKKLIFKINALVWSCMSKINKTFIGNAEDVDIIMPFFRI